MNEYMKIDHKQYFWKLLMVLFALVSVSMQTQSLDYINAISVASAEILLIVFLALSDLSNAYLQKQILELSLENARLKIFLVKGREGKGREGKASGRPMKDYEESVERLSARIAELLTAEGKKAGIDSGYVGLIIRDSSITGTIDIMHNYKYEKDLIKILKMAISQLKDHKITTR